MPKKNIRYRGLNAGRDSMSQKKEGSYETFVLLIPREKRGDANPRGLREKAGPAYRAGLGCAANRPTRNDCRMLRKWVRRFITNHRGWVEGESPAHTGEPGN